MAIKYDFSERPDFDWNAALESEEIKQVEAEGHGRQGAQNDYYRIVRQAQEKIKKGEELTFKERGICTMMGMTADRVATIVHHGDWVVKHYGMTTSEARANPTKHAQAYVDFHNEFGFDMCTPCASDCGVIEMEALGQGTMHTEDGTDLPTNIIINNEKDVWKLREHIETTDFRKCERVAERMEMFKEIKRLSNDTMCITPQHGGAPFVFAWSLCGYKNLMTWVKKKPQLLHLVLDTLTFACYKFIDIWKNDVGAHGLVHYGGTTGLPHLREWQGLEFAVPYAARVHGYAWPLPIIEYNWGAPYAIGIDPQKYDAKKMGAEENWLRWQMRDWVGSGSAIFTDVASDSDIPPGNNLATFRDLGLYFKKGYQVAIHGEEMREGTPEFLTRKVVKWLLDMHPCEGGALIRALYLDPNECSPENVLAFTNAVKEYGSFPIDRAKLEGYLKDNPGPLICYEVKGLEGELLKKEAEKAN